MAPGLSLFRFLWPGTMWIVDNQTDFAAEANWTRDERGAEFWLVIARAAFEIGEDGVQRLAEEQTPVQRMPVFTGDPLTTGLLTDSDFVPKRQRGALLSAWRCG